MRPSVNQKKICLARTDQYPNEFSFLHLIQIAVHWPGLMNDGCGRGRSCSPGWSSRKNQQNKNRIQQQCHVASNVHERTFSPEIRIRGQSALCIIYPSPLSVEKDKIAPYRPLGISMWFGHGTNIWYTACAYSIRTGWSMKRIQPTCIMKKALWPDVTLYNLVVITVGTNPEPNRCFSRTHA